MKRELTLESLLTSPTGFDLAASPLQRAICRAADGRRIGPVLVDASCEQRFGCEKSRIGLSRPVLVVLICGVRSGKSLMAACAAVTGCMTADLRALKPHEIARYAIVAPTVDNATATFKLLLGHVQASSVLAAMIVGDPTQDTLTLRRPDGRIVEIVVAAAHRGGVTLRSRWLAGFVLDEVALFGAEVQGASINADELLRAAETRLVRLAQGWLITSPMGPSGLVHELWLAHFGKPGRILVVHAPTSAMNPTFPAEQIAAVRARTPDVAAREYDAEWIDADTAFHDGPRLDAATRVSPLEEPPRTDCDYAAAWDSATRGNSWTFVIARAERTRHEVTRVIVVLARQWTGSKVKPLDPEAVIGEIAKIAGHYGVSRIACDGWGADALRAIAKRHGLDVRDRTMSTSATYDAHDHVRMLSATGRLELPPHPVLVQDLKSVRKVALANQIKIVLPRTADGRHADFAPSVVLVCSEAPRARSRPRPAVVYRPPVQTIDSPAAGLIRYGAHRE